MGPEHIPTNVCLVPFEATPNLYEALLHLRDPFFEQILWIDAICINQQDVREKATQVAAMARIYGLAKRVVVWLGAEADGSTFAFQKLRDMAPMHQSADRSQSGENLSWFRREDNVIDGDVDNDFDREVGSLGVEQAILLLLHRPYFRRMWKILQEVTAARNMLLKCGDAEMQTVTFLAGLDALKGIYDWELRSRILAFSRLIKTSNYRESFKGQAHLKIEPLTELIDRFHAHDATDPRDKVYALWGLSSDSDLMMSLQPDYKKSWKELLQRLGKIVFGEDSSVSASACRQTMFVRTTGYDIGRVEHIAHGDEGRLWENTQVIQITSTRVSRFPGPGRVWSVYVNIRVPSERLLEDDIVLFLPHASRIIFARPTKYYLQVVMAIGSRIVHVLDSDGRRVKSGCEWWQSWSDDIDEDTKDFPLLWSWEKDCGQDEEEALKLMSDQVMTLYSPTDWDRHRTLLQATAMSNMAALFMDFEHYHQASTLLTEAVLIYESLYIEEHAIAVAARGRLDNALDRKFNYLKAQELFSRRCEHESEDNMADLYALVILLSIEPAYVEVTHGIVHVSSSNLWADFASKVMSEGVSKEMLLQALQHLPFPEDTTVNSTWAKSLNIKTTAPSIHRALGNVSLAQDYLEFLLAMASDDITISASELLTAARLQIRSTSFVRLAERSDYPLQNLPEILEAFRSRQMLGMYMREIVVDLGDRIVVTPDAINVAAKWNADTLSTLLKAAKGAPVVAPAAFTIAMQNLSEFTPAIVAVLAQHAEPGCTIPEEALRLIAHDDRLDRTELQWIFVSLLEHTNLVVNIHESLLVKPSGLYAIENDIYELLHFRPKSHFPRAARMEEASRYGDLRTRSLLESTGPVRPDAIDAIPGNDIVGYASFINLVRYRKHEFRITRKLILRVAGEKKKAAASVSWLYGEDEAPWESLLVIDRCTAFLIRHTDNYLIGYLASTSGLIDIAASRGLVRVLETLQRRLKGPCLNFDALHIVAELCQLLQRPSQPGESYTAMPKIISLVQSLARTEHKSISDNVKREMFLHARREQDSGAVIDSLLENGILDEDVVKIWEAQSLDTEAGHQETESGIPGQIWVESN
ncbi:uncharacterized protein N0V89_011431 [Didymosphaeria variabile]|uniref:Heterokaryon incompatibility domain-containing protein n=1 Tax=Didymosphaeria variabile TaxID=1932322 RepID=A0A9W9C4R3_9PLEO|nr:uncharacterized protein N0V89_011431 [Didymosphaeria variabile]KAJ4345301.1 hypothetical protein N0V89_011431 [Didymosphaeria variabile]